MFASAPAKTIPAVGLLLFLVASMFFNLAHPFVQLPPAQLPDGVMPKNKRAASTGVTVVSLSSVAVADSSTAAAASTSSTTHSSAAAAPTTSTSTTAASTPSTTTAAHSTTTTAAASHTADSTTTAAASSSAQHSTVSSAAATSQTAGGHTSSTHHDDSTTRSSATRSSTTDSSATASSDIVKLGSTTINRATLKHKSTVTDALVTSHTEATTFTSIFTSNGQAHTEVVTKHTVVASTTGYSTSVITPTLAAGGGSGSNLSGNTKDIIGGVVGGIGGALLLAGLAFVIFRLWGRKKRRAADHDDADYLGSSQNDSLAAEKRASQGDGLERYRRGAPPSSPNTASNF